MKVVVGSDHAGFKLKEHIKELLAKGYGTPRRRSTDPLNDPRKVFEAFLDRLRSVTVLDPACGSGNFLYIALQSLKDLEKEVKELRRANEILKDASIFFATELDGRPKK